MYFYGGYIVRLQLIKFIFLSYLRQQKNADGHWIQLIYFCQMNLRWIVSLW